MQLERVVVSAAWLRRWGSGTVVLMWSLMLPIATAWRVGNLDDPTAATSKLPINDRIEPWVTGSAERIVTRTGMVLLVMTSLVILILAVCRWFDGRWWLVLLGAGAVGIPIGWWYRVATAATVDADMVRPLATLLLALWTALILPFVIAGAIAILTHPEPTA